PRAFASRSPPPRGRGMTAERQFAISGRWALAADSLQWMLQRQYMHKGQVCWRSVSFVSSTRDILARCMREKGCPPADAERLLAGLPATFEEWGRARAQSCIETGLVDGEASGPLMASPPSTSMAAVDQWRETRQSPSPPVSDDLEPSP